ncbi:DUF192 domain-containing protein [Collimonas humicola]|uniref:DUF192 domain-containing protein n=1 Tax=Collimonas humicola TaxID=2825886 RepID=UPI001B8C1F9C|nr:DUF192 domain-containing protein [Collimonas humicola]
MQIDMLDIRIARYFWSRAIGLLGTRSLSDRQGLLIVPCNSVHTFFMLFAIDVVFIDRAGKISRIVEQMRPWRFAGAKAHSCLELNAGNAARLGLQVGQCLSQLAHPVSEKIIRLDLAMLATLPGISSHRHDN